jgi:hypothetical protein
VTLIFIILIILKVTAMPLTEWFPKLGCKRSHLSVRENAKTSKPQYRFFQNKCMYVC